MLAYVLALAVGLGSLAIYMAAFFFPEVHRKNDFIWSGVGLFYALVLWVCAGRITGGVLLGQAAGIALLGWSVSQTLSLRRQLTPRSQQTELPSASEVKNAVQDKVSNLSLFDRVSQLGKRVGGSAGAAKERLKQNVSGDNQRQSQEVNSKVQIIDNRTPIPQPVNIGTTEQLTTDTLSATESVSDVIQPNSPQPDELVQSARESAAAENALAKEDSPIQPSQLVPDADAEIEPALTEEEAITLAVETTLAGSATPEASEAITEPVRPHPPEPEIVEAAIRDAEEKHQQASPPEPETPENPSPS